MTTLRQPPELWQRPARPLPVRVRPVGGESVVSFTFRLAAANHLVHPTSVLRALGESRPRLPTRADLPEQDVVLNDRALHRLEALADIPAARLRRALPALDRGATGALFPGRVPTLRLYRCPRLRSPCDTCRSRVAGPGPVVVHPRPNHRISAPPTGSRCQPAIWCSSSMRTAQHVAHIGENFAG